MQHPGPHLLSVMPLYSLLPQGHGLLGNLAPAAAEVRLFGGGGVEAAIAVTKDFIYRSTLLLCSPRGPQRGKASLTHPHRLNSSLSR